MTHDKDHSAPYTASDIQRYHSGGMSPQEMHLLEKAALDDPFLADALEGYALTPTPVQDIAEIRERLRQKTDTRKVVPLFTRYPWMRAAAIILFVVGAGLLAWQLSFSPKGGIAIQQPAAVEEAPRSAPSSDVNAYPTDSVLAPPVSTINEDAREDRVAKENPSAPLNRSTLPATPSQSRPATVTSAPARSLPMAAEQKEEAALKRDAGNKETARNNEPSYRQRNVQAAENNASPQQAYNYYNGRVVDAQSNAVPFATISNTRDRNVIMTDKDGFFTLKSSDSTIDATVSAPGFEVNSLQLENSRSNTVVMKENAGALQEVVVTSAYGNQKKRETMQTQKITDTLEPAEGWPYFDDYIARSLEARSDQELQSIDGEVRLSFEVNRNGEPVNIRVVKSLCPRCDEEAIRLLKEGPKWKKKKNKKGKVTIRF